MRAAVAAQSNPKTAAGGAPRRRAWTLTPARVEQAYTELAKKRDEMEKRRLRRVLEVVTFFDQVAREEVAALRESKAAGVADHGEIVVDFEK